MPDGDRWALDLDSLDRAVGKHTKVIMVCNPNNPTGAVLTEGEMEAVLEVAERRGAWIVADEIYRGAEVDTDAHVPDLLGPQRPGRRDERLVEGIRDAGAARRMGRGADEDRRTHLAPARLHDTDAGDPQRPVHRLGDASADAREHPRAHANDHPREPAAARGVVRGAARVSRYRRPAAGAIAFAQVDLPMATRDLVERIREERSVLLVPGEMFGIDNGIRIGFGYHIDETLEGLALVGETLAAAAIGPEVRWSRRARAVPHAADRASMRHATGMRRERETPGRPQADRGVGGRGHPGAHRGRWARDRSQLIADPTGAVIGARVSWLEATPVHDWAPVGWFLLVVMGVVPSLIAVGVVTRFSWPLAERLDPSASEHWSWTATQVMGDGLLVWIGLQLALIDLHGGPQPMFVVLGVALARRCRGCRASGGYLAADL